MVDFTEGSRIQITVADDTVYVVADGNVLLRATAPIISVSMTQDHRPTAATPGGRVVNEQDLLQLANELREGFKAAFAYYADPDVDPDIEDLSESEMMDRLNTAHRAAARLTQIERERAGQERVDSGQWPVVSE